MKNVIHFLLIYQLSVPFELPEHISRPLDIHSIIHPIIKRLLCCNEEFLFSIKHYFLK